jgi:hypothetical protein
VRKLEHWSTTVAIAVCISSTHALTSLRFSGMMRNLDQGLMTTGKDVDQSFLKIFMYT